MTKFDDTFSSRQITISTPSLKNVELKKWCVKKAARISCNVDCDIVATAQKIYDWVTK